MNGSSPSGSKYLKSDAPKLLGLAKSGDRGALKVLLARERPLLYDYLMRMTGQMQRSFDTVDEVFLAMNARALQDVEDIRQLRAILITTVRKFSLDIWNAATPLLENAGLAESQKSFSRSGKPLSSPPSGQRLLFDKIFRTLPGGEREVLWLGWNLQWDEETIAKATFRTKPEVETLQSQALATIRAQAPSLASLDRRALGDLQVPHPVEDAKTGVTVELSQVMRGIKESPQKRILKRQLILVGILLSILFCGVYKRNIIIHSFKHLLGVRGHGRSDSP